ncbi:hypothetical protein NNA36_12225 [Shimia sp. CNT1-13L.2]|uniref:hypothetical protein n=1 Tax=Shimia sp. CNT1-13L.2 TaxID=2959663 RepID=UPI0020CCB5CC|nr:hypothetical protein [Shimia sp. CNT1-13L.2]MCP9482728.1 hypothetical protein [Shimia sp. CNT1-13L.2]
MNFVRLALLPIVLVFTTALPGLGATATEQSCNFVNAFIDSKSKAFQALETTFGHNENALQTIVGSISALPDKFDEGAVVEVANVGGLVVEHFIVLNQQDIGSIYVRFVYEKSVEDMVAVRFSFNSKLDKILEDWPMLQDPVDINC